MRIPRSKIRAKFACNKEGSEEFAAMLEDSIESQEIMAEYEALSKGLSYQKMNNYKKREFLCQLFN